jgi:tRNA threonylcarbamoyladenosine biosynthesis protein TsaB
MKLLAIDTSTEACSAALVNGSRYHARFELTPQQHAERILAMIEAVLAEAGLPLNALDGLAYGRGPGAFTGVRIAAGVIQGIGLATDLKVAPVSSLAALAQGCMRRYGASAVLAVMDARINEVYCGGYRAGPGGGLQGCLPERVCGPGEIELPAGSHAGEWTGAGSGFDAYRELLAVKPASLESVYPSLLPDALDVATLAVGAFERGEAVSADQALPVYLRDQVARTMDKR